MSIEIDVLNGDASWPLAEPLFDAVWPPEVVETLPWADVVFAHADLRVLVQTEADDVVCHVGIYRREVTWNGRKIRAGGIGGVATREDRRRQRLRQHRAQCRDPDLEGRRRDRFRAVVLRAAQRAVLHGPRLEAVRGRDLCRTAARAAFASPLSRPMSSNIRRAPRQGTIDLCGLPW